jgi:hypothetical protein
MGDNSHDRQSLLAQDASTRSSNCSQEVFCKFVQRKEPEVKKILLLSFNALIIVVVIACQSVEQSFGNLMLRPGDEIDGMTLTTGAVKAPPLWAFCSAAQADQHVTKTNCYIPPTVSKVAIGYVFNIVDEFPTKSEWSEFAWKLSVDEQDVDLASFGTYDFSVPSMLSSPSPIRKVFKTFTAWDVVLMNLKPGVHTVYGLAQSETDTYTWSINLTIETSDVTDFESIP